jgi:hypothetical protein
MTDNTFNDWVIIELMGHRRLAGYLSEVEIGGEGFLRLDVPGRDGPSATQFYRPAAVYCITPTTEDLARSVAAQSMPQPVSRYELEPPHDDTAWLDVGESLTQPEEDSDHG